MSSTHASTPSPPDFHRYGSRTSCGKELAFDGVVFSDDLSMEGASGAGGIVERAEAALRAGCDMVLVCNDGSAADRLLEHLDYAMPAVALMRLARMHGRRPFESMVDLREDARYRDALHAIAGIGLKSGDLPLGA